MKIYTSQELSLPANKAVFEEIVLLIAHAFNNDACTQYLFSNHSREAYLEDLPLYKRKLMRLALLCDASFLVITEDDTPRARKTAIEETATTDRAGCSAICGVGVLIPPHGNASFDSTIVHIRAGAGSMPFKFGLRFMWRLMTEFLPGIHKMHDKTFPDRKTKYDNWHLFYLATHADYRGQGLGKQILLESQDVVRRYNKTEAEKAHLHGKDFTQVPLYIEASNAVNKRLYNRVGFEDQATFTYGKLDNKDDNLKVDDNGKVLGGKIFGMLWTP